VTKKTGTLAQPQLAPSSRQRARPHTPENYRIWANKSMVIIPHPPYSSDLAPCDFALFLKLQMNLKGRRFETVSDHQRELDNVKENGFHCASEAWKKQRDRCKRSQGDGSQN
jgi:hypothetical protein